MSCPRRVKIPLHISIGMYAGLSLLGRMASVDVVKPASGWSDTGLVVSTSDTAGPGAFDSMVTSVPAMATSCDTAGGAGFVVGADARVVFP